MGQLDGRVALITGGARGQGRTHAVALARAGADVVLADVCHDLGTVPYPMATEAELKETVALVEAEGRRALGVTCDVRDAADVDAAVARAVDAFGRVDILVANAGVSVPTPLQATTPELWADVIAINLTGAFHAIRAVSPVMSRQRWGRIVATSSMLGRMGSGAMAAYVSSKWGLIGLVKSAAQDLAGFGVTVNAVAPGNVATPMIFNDALYRTVRPDLAEPTREDLAGVLQTLHLQPIPWIEPEEVSRVVLFLVGEGGDHITGAVIDISAGASARFTA